MRSRGDFKDIFRNIYKLDGNDGYYIDDTTGYTKKEIEQYVADKIATMDAYFEKFHKYPPREVMQRVADDFVKRMRAKHPPVQMEFDFRDVALEQKPNGELTLSHKTSAAERKARVAEKKVKRAIVQTEQWAKENGIKHSIVAYNGGSKEVREYLREMRGKGTGAAVFGEGVYLALRPLMARGYAEMASPLIVNKNSPFGAARKVSKAFWQSLGDLENGESKRACDMFAVALSNNLTRDGVDWGRVKTDILEKARHVDVGSAMRQLCKQFIEFAKKQNYEISQAPRYLHTVEIPDDTGTNYLEWDMPVPNEIFERANKALGGILDAKSKQSGRAFYEELKTQSLFTDKSNVKDPTNNTELATWASDFLHSLGIVGMKHEHWGEDCVVIYDESNVRVKSVEKFSLSKRVEEGYLSQLAKRKDYTPEEMEKAKAFLATLKAADEDHTKFVLVATKWIKDGKIRLPEDELLVREAIDLSQRKHIDPMQYKSPLDLICANKLLVANAGKKLSPDDSRFDGIFTNKQEEAGCDVYDVEDSERGQQAVIDILRSHLAQDVNSPWCLATWTNTGKPTESAKHYWNHYSAVGRKIAFKDGKAFAFWSNSEDGLYDSIDEGGRDNWWDFEDSQAKMLEECEWRKELYGKNRGGMVEKVQGRAKLMLENVEGKMVLRKRETSLADGGKRHEEFREDGTIAHLEERDENYEAHGRIVNYNQDGTVDEFTEYKHGEAYHFVEYDNDGGINVERKRTDLDNGEYKIESTAKFSSSDSVNYYRADGELVKTQVFDKKSGTLEKEEIYHAGNGVGKEVVFYNENGKVAERRLWSHLDDIGAVLLERYREDGTTEHSSRRVQVGTDWLESKWADFIFDERGNVIPELSYDKEMPTIQDSSTGLFIGRESMETDVSALSAEGRAIVEANRAQAARADAKFSLSPVEQERVARDSAAFNDALGKQIRGELPAGYMHDLGAPSSILQSVGFGHQLGVSARLLAQKTKTTWHEYPIEALNGLTEAVNDPVAIFWYGNPDRPARNVIADLQYEGKNFVAGFYLNPVVGGRALERDTAQTVFPKNNYEWLNWFVQGKALYVNKEKVQAILNQLRTNPARVEWFDLNSVQNVIDNFVNPQVKTDFGGSALGGNDKYSLSPRYDETRAKLSKAAFENAGFNNLSETALSFESMTKIAGKAVTLATWMIHKNRDTLPKYVVDERLGKMTAAEREITLNRTMLLYEVIRDGGETATIDTEAVRKVYKRIAQQQVAARAAEMSEHDNILRGRERFKWQRPTNKNVAKKFAFPQKF